MRNKYLSVSTLLFALTLPSCGGASSSSAFSFEAASSAASSNLEEISSSSSSSETRTKTIGNIIEGSIRIQTLDENTIRFEVGENGSFFDDPSLFIPERSHFEGVFLEERSDATKRILTFDDVEIDVPLNATNLAGVQVIKGGELVYEYQRFFRNNGTLPTPFSTPAAYALMDCPRISIPEHGYSYNPEGDAMSDYALNDKAVDLYVLLTGKSAKKLRQEYVKLTGASEMVPFSALGSWDSRYYAYNEGTALLEIANYDKYNLPLDNFVLDTDWRKSHGADGIGYDVNTSLFPNMEDFLNEVHDQNIQVMFNDHPEPVAGTTSVFSPNEVQYRHDNLTKYLDMGLDYWWYDRNWTVALKSPSNFLTHETLGMYLYQDIEKQYYQSQAADPAIYRRPLIMGNGDQIKNGAYVGITNTASHRFSMQWTGDSFSDASSLAQEVKDIIRGGIDAIPYLNSDIGGHQGNPSNELYARWVQYGALSPIFRPHSSKYNLRYRQPWLYGDDDLAIAREYIQMRYRLLPFYYALAHENYETGLPLIRSLGFNYPDDPKANRYDEWLLGNDILFAPITDDVYGVVPSSDFVTPIHAKYYGNTTLQGEPLVETDYNDINFDWGESSPESGVPSDNFSASYEGDITLPETATISVMVDDGFRFYLDGKLTYDAFTSNDSVTYDVANLKAGEKHHFKIEYYDGQYKARLKMFVKRESGNYSKSVYLPAGRWMDVFNGTTYQGGASYDIACNLRTSPLFVRLGTLLPLVEQENNTSLIDWSRFAFDFYPDKEAVDESEIYEDDKKTTAYKLGHYRKTPYRSYFNKQDNAFYVEISPSVGTFEGADEFSKRNLAIRYHDIEGLGKLSEVQVNGQRVAVELYEKDRKASPFAFSYSSPDNDVFTIPFESDLTSKTIVKFILA
jgi:alpha-glucosidase (family GH31 glycosyl hydrolase)